MAATVEENIYYLGVNSSEFRELENEESDDSDDGSESSCSDLLLRNGLESFVIRHSILRNNYYMAQCMSARHEYVHQTGC